MFAVVEINDKQHLVREGDVLTIDGTITDKTISFDNILLVQDENNTTIGQPYVDKASVVASVLETGKREKDIVFKFKRKTGYKVTKGHRQNSTVIKITKISGETKKTKPKTEKKEATKSKAEKKEPVKEKAKKTTKKED